MKLNTQNVSLKISAGTADQFPKEPIPQIVFSGKSNVGKSSLINMLLGRKSLARVSSSPGKTITVNFYDIDKKLCFVDLPGYGFAKRPPEERAKWSKLTDSYVRSAHTSKKLFLQLIDCKSGPSEDDVNMVRWLETNGVPYVIVATKCDKPNKTDRETVLSILRERGRHVIPCSSETGEGKNEIWAEIFRVTGL